ncbi:protein kinase family protein [Neobacillus notoginsengisoli]|uniref:Protein kinase family protein n=1 Tax=Neobacillus notoginsengisoli TaxID=1578198 RepID=A0A417YGB2_9BACI|nr:protein kinase [Neobacillus notoginsengisoli]RHW31819.1 protein kinase family protein [Neobacillus notoginsengisoli]
MMHPSKNQCNFKPGTVIEGKWHGHRYVLLKELGKGANGTVYLVKRGNFNVALKISTNSMSVTSEANVLKSFAKVQGPFLGPSLLDVDDWITKDGRYSFYVMEYIKGSGLQEFLGAKGKDWIQPLFLQLLHDLGELHRNGWIFGDLKPENLIVAGPPTRIRCIDVGGTTIEGRSIKEFTEFFDRGYWGLGSRKAEPSYDLFAVAMVMISTSYPGRFQKQEGGLTQLLGAISTKEALRDYKPVLTKALQGKYTAAIEMRNDLLSCTKQFGFSEKTPHRTRMALRQAVHQTQLARARGKKAGIGETFYIVSVMAILYIVYIVMSVT